MRISDWSSDVCSSDLYVQVLRGGLGLFAASDEVTLDDWLRYVDTLQLAQNYPGFKSLSYAPAVADADLPRSEEHTSELQSLMRISYAVFCRNTKTTYSTSH